MSDLDLLEKLAREATPGPWVIDKDHHRCYLKDEDDCGYKNSPVTEAEVYLKSEGCHEDAFSHVHESYEAHQISPCIAGNYDYEEGGIIETVDAEFIAAANPAVVLDLIARVKSAEAERDAYKARLDAVRATVEYEKHWNDGYGWDVATIRILAALDGDPTG